MKVLVTKNIVPDYVEKAVRGLYPQGEPLTFLAIGELDSTDFNALLKILRSRKEREGWVYIENLDNKVCEEQIRRGINSLHYAFRFYETSTDEDTDETEVTGIFQVDPTETMVGRQFIAIWRHPDYFESEDKRAVKLEVRM